MRLAGEFVNNNRVHEWVIHSCTNQFGEAMLAKKSLEFAILFLLLWVGHSILKYFSADHGLWMVLMFAVCSVGFILIRSRLLENK